MFANFYAEPTAFLNEQLVIITALLIAGVISGIVHPTKLAHVSLRLSRGMGGLAFGAPYIFLEPLAIRIVFQRPYRFIVMLLIAMAISFITEAAIRMVFRKRHFRAGPTNHRLQRSGGGRRFGNG
jgi:hypothetical protein